MGKANKDTSDDGLIINRLLTVPCSLADASVEEELYLS